MTGARLNYHSSPFGQKGGLSIYPVSGILTGCEITAAATTATANVAALTINTGDIKFDSYRVRQGLTSVNITVEAGVDLTTDTYEFMVYLNPNRKVKVVKVGVADPVVVDGGMFIQAYEFEGYYQVNQIYIGENGAWRVMDGYRDLKVGSYGWNNMPLNDIDTVTAISATNFSITPEMPIFHKTSLPPHICKPSNALLRQTASIELAKVKFEGGVGSIVTGIPESARLAI